MKSRIEALSIILLILAPILKGQVTDTLQPYAPHWFIDELLEWKPENDEDAIFNRSFTPLATKHFNPELKVNEHSRPNEAKVEMLPIFAPTNGNPSQGSLNKNYYAFTYWQYNDLMVYWGGSSYEGIILTPTAPVTDAAHKHGVPVYGTVFFPPEAYGGKRQWVYDFVEERDGVFPVADKLIEVANYYGFDGWFINQETGRYGEVEEDTVLAKAMQQFMLYYKENTKLSIQWYDAMLNNGTVWWQHEINDRNKMFFQQGDKAVSDEMFLDFRYTSTNLKNTKEQVDRFNRDIYDVYGGIDTQTNGYETEVGYSYPHGANFDVLFPEGKPHAASLAFYVPSWTFSSAANMEDFYKRESRFWVGEKGDPQHTGTEHNWKGVAHYVPAKSSVNNIPFVTHFCTGQGEKFFLNGKDVTASTWTEGWNNLTLQDIQPTWRWIVKSKGEALNVGYDFSDAYNGGNCLKVEGKSEHDNIIPLYSTRLNLDRKSMLSLVFKKNKETNFDVLLTFKDGEEKIVVIEEKNDYLNYWYDKTISLSKFKGKQLIRIALRVSSSNSDSLVLKIGQLGIVNKIGKQINAPKNVKVIAKTPISKNAFNIRLKWDMSDAEDIYYYRVYKTGADGAKIYLGATTSNACFLPKVPRKENEQLKIVVEAVGKGFRVSQSNTYTLIE